MNAKTQEKPAPAKAAAAEPRPLANETMPRTVQVREGKRSRAAATEPGSQAEEATLRAERVREGRRSRAAATERAPQAEEAALRAGQVREGRRSRAAATELAPQAEEAALRAGRVREGRRSRAAAAEPGPQAEEAALRAELARQYRELDARGLNELASGNVSARLGDEMLISPAGATAGSIRPEAVVRMTLDGAVQGEGKPSSEWRMHAGIYKRTRAKAVVHTHSDHCVALSCQGRGLPGFHYLVGSFGGSDVPWVPYSTFGSEELAADAVKALQERSACLLGSHGMVCRGRSLEQAVTRAHRLEIMCRQYLLACQLGEPYLLTKAEWQDFFNKVRKTGYGPDKKPPSL